MIEGSVKSEKRFAGRIGATASESQPDKPAIVRPPQCAPNVVVVLLDDVGFGSAATFGGPVPMPTRDALAQQQAAVQQPVPQQAAAPAADSLDSQLVQIQKLSVMKDQGLITEEEFTAKKAQILGI